MRTKLNPAFRYAILASIVTATAAACTNEQPTDVDQAYAYLDNAAGAGATSNTNQTSGNADLLSQTAALLTPTSTSDTNIAPGSSTSDAIEEGTATLTDLISKASNLLSDLVDNNTSNLASTINTNSNVVGDAITTSAEALPSLSDLLNFGVPLPNILGTGTSLLDSNSVGTQISDLIGDASDAVSDQLTASAANTSNINLTGNLAAQSANIVQTNLCANLPCLQSTDCNLATLWGCQVTSCINNRCAP